MAAKSNEKPRYSKADVEKALLAVRAGSSIRDAAAKFKVPRSTLNDKRREKYSYPSAGKPAVLLGKEEAEIEKWLLEMAAAGLPVTEEILRVNVGRFAFSLGKSEVFKGGLPSRGWVTKFLRRHPSISKRTANQLAKKRVMSEEEIRAWFEEVITFLRSKEGECILNQPGRVFNMDESAFQMAPNQRKKVFAGKKNKNVQSVQGNSNRESYTVMMAGSAAGKLAPPLILFPYKERLPREIVNSIPVGWGVGKTDKGWMDTGSFYEYMTNVFYPWLVTEQVEFPVVLFVDGHRSHVTYETVQFCKEKEIYLVSLPPNSTHFIQPLDVSFFKPMKAAWDTELTNWRFENGGAMITRPDFAPLLKRSIDRMADVENTLINGFRKCGLVPWNPEAIDYSSLVNPDAVSPSYRQNIPVPEVAYSASPALSPAILLNEINKRIPSELVEEFEAQQRNLFWTGNPDALLLFNLWRNVKEEANGPLDYFEIDPALIDLAVPVENIYESNESELRETTTSTIYNPDDRTVSEDSEHQDIEDDTSLSVRLGEDVNDDSGDGKMETTVSDQMEMISVEQPHCSYFKVYPGNGPKTGKRRIPAVATSETWEEYYREQDAIKRRRLEERQEKAKSKEEKKAARLALAKEKAELKKIEKEKRLAEKAAKLIISKENAELKRKEKQKQIAEKEKRKLKKQEKKEEAREAGSSGSEKAE